MSALTPIIHAQFRKPTGWLGSLAGWIMFHRSSNRMRNLWTLELLELKPGQTVIELGFGPGFALIEACKKVRPNGKVFGIDHSDLMAAAAAQRNQQMLSGGQLQLVIGDITTELPRLPQANAIYLSNVFQFVEDRAQLLSSIYQQLTPNGRLAITHQPRHKGATLADLAAFKNRTLSEVGAAGFRKFQAHQMQLKPIDALCVLAEKI